MEKRKSISIGEGVPEQNGGRASASETERRNRTEEEHRYQIREEEYQHQRRSAGTERRRRAPASEGGHLRKSIGIRLERGYRSSICWSCCRHS